MTDAGNTARPRVQSAARVVDILKLVAEADAQGVTASTISQRLGLPRQVVYHLAHTLTANQMLRKVGRNSYILGVGIGPLVNGFRRQISAQLPAYARQAAAETGEAAYVSGWIGDEIVVLATARGASPVQAVELPLGTAGNAHARASGKLILAMSASDDVARYLAVHPLVSLTPNTCTSPKQLAAALAEIRKTWVSIEREEYARGLSCMAVPIPAAPSDFVLGVSAPTARFEECWEDYRTALLRIAKDGPSDIVV